MKIAHLSSMDFHGAGKAAYRLHKGLQSIGATSSMWVMAKGTSDDSVFELPSAVAGRPDAWWRFVSSGWEAQLSGYPQRPNDGEVFSLFSSRVQWNQIPEGILTADVINLHWAAGIFNVPTICRVLKGKCIVWTLHDMNAFTGGCHYAGECLRYRDACGMCPRLASNSASDLSHAGWLEKTQAYREIDINVVTPSRWLESCSRSSSLFGWRHHAVIPNGLPLGTYAPGERDRIRNALNIPTDAKVILFCASSAVLKRKGLTYLFEALDHMSKSRPGIRIILAVMGAGFPDRKVVGGYPVMNFGSIASESRMAIVYNAADVFVLPSLQDNLPNTVLESMACGTPVAAFATGGIPDIVEHGSTGWLAPHLDTARLAEAVDWCLHHSPPDIRQRCRIRMEKHFSLEVQAQRYLDLYQSLCPLDSADHRAGSARAKVTVSENGSNQARSAASLGAPWNSSTIRTFNASPDMIGTFKTLRSIRNALAAHWQDCAEGDLARGYSGEEGKMHRDLSSGPLKELELSPSERLSADQCIANLARQESSDQLARNLLSAMLYLSAYELPGADLLQRLPDWLVKDYLCFLLELPASFRVSDAIPTWCCHLENVMEHICNGLNRDPESRVWQHLSFVFAQKAKMLPFYFTRRDVKRAFRMRASIVEYALERRRYALDYMFPERRSAPKRLRLGVYCRSFVPYTETFATIPLFKHIDRSVFEVHLYASHSDGNSFESMVRSWSDTFKLLPESIKGSVQAVREDDLDILMFGNNLTPVSGTALLLASHRLARSQGVHFCNPVTTGLRNMDFFILGNRLLLGRDPCSETFSEHVLDIPGSGICFDLPELYAAGVPALSRARLGVPEQACLFLSGANFFKITPELLRLWIRVLNSVPNSLLVLYPFGPAWGSSYPKQIFLEDLKRVFGECGVDPERVIVLDTLSDQNAVLALNRLADVYLDAVPYNGATSLLDPMRAGTPVVVVDGGELRFAQGAAMLREMGIPELVAADEEEYVRLAASLAADAGMRQSLRERIQERMHRAPDFLNSQLYGRRISEALLRLVSDRSIGLAVPAASPHPHLDTAIACP